MKRFRQLCVPFCTAVLFVAATGSTTHAVVAGENGRILFTRCVWAGDCTWEIVAADPDGSDEVVLAGPYPREAWDDHFTANWSPDGETAIFMAYQAIWQVNADGTHLHKIWEPPTKHTGIDDGPSFTPDGEHIVFTRCCPRVSGYALWMINADGTGLKQVTDESVPPGVDGPSDNLPQVSPDGTRIAYHRNVVRNGHDHNRVVTVNMDGKDRIQLTPPFLNAQVPNWSPDSKRVVFIMFPPSGGIEVGIVRADGTHLHQLTHSGKFVSTWPSFSPDGSRIIFSRSMPGGWVGLFTMNPDGSEVTLISRHGLSDNWPQWAAARSA
jgi:Tol biopolymer transport system component